MPVVIEEIASLACPSAQIEDDTANQIFAIILQDWMFNYGSLYVRGDFNLLYGRINSLISKQLPLHFFLPGFPVKSPNTNEKVLGTLPDFSEFLAIRSLQTTARKLQAIYQAGVKIKILSDYHTFDQYIAVDEQEYFAYHRGLKKMIQEAGADDIIELISLSTFPEFKGVPTKEISTFLCMNFGGDDFLSQFDENILNDQSLLEKYRQLRKFMMTDLKFNLPGSPSSKSSKRYIKEVARGIMAQGVALDTFLKKQCMISNYVRLSIHHHHPQSGKFAIDLFKEHASSNGVLRTPWHHVTLFDSAQGRFIINHKIKVEKEVVDGSILVKAKYDDKDWLYVRLYMEDDFFGLFNDKTDSPPLEMSLYRSRCGLMLINKLHDKTGAPISSDFVKKECLTNLVKEFGLVVLRGFKEFANEDAMIKSYKERAPNGLLEWNFGLVHKVKPLKESSVITSSFEGLPMHFDMVALPRYMEISQDGHRYEDFVCREFLLYCRQGCSDINEGQTTFVDAHSAVISMNGMKIQQWKDTVLQYETQASTGKDKDVYFGGQGNYYQYPIVQTCPWTGKDVLRWLQSWTPEEHPNSRQLGSHKVKSFPFGLETTSEELESEICQLAFDKRFYFGHSYEQGDQVYVNNYTTLHGRKGFSQMRELWRIQAVPPSDNLPSYFAKHSL